MGTKRQFCFTKIGRFVDDYLADLVGGIAVALVLVGSLAFSDELVTFASENEKAQETIRNCALASFIIGLGLQAVSFMLNKARGRRISELEEENNVLRAAESLIANNVQQLVDGYLASWATGPLGFGEDEYCSERISLYSFDAEGGQFVLVGRFSFSPVYQAKQRATYPSDQGCIEVAWKNGVVFSNDFPDPYADPEGYSKHHLGFNVPADVSDRFTMKSRLYYGYRISDAKHRGLAVVIIEALCPTRFTQEKLDKFFARDERQYISELVSILQPHFTVPSAATKLGM
jgi:hypothetical protein